MLLLIQHSRMKVGYSLPNIYIYINSVGHQIDGLSL